MHRVSFLAIIPARYASTRFPGKPLVDIKGKSMIQRVYEQASNSVNEVVVATDDERIFSEVQRFGGQVIMTSADHQSGTDRCAEALEKFELENKVQVDVVVNIQGDEPFIQKEQIELLKSCFSQSETQIATLIKPIEDESVICDPNRPKVVITKQGAALYFSRSPVPYVRNSQTGTWKDAHTFFQHIGLYAYRAEVLREITKLPIGNLEKAESLEQLRWLENGYHIQTAQTVQETYGIDTPEDLEKLLSSGII